MVNWSFLVVSLGLFLTLLNKTRSCPVVLFFWFYWFGHSFFKDKYLNRQDYICFPSTKRSVSLCYGMLILTNYNSPFHTGQFLFKSEWCRSGSSEDKEASPHFICHFCCRGCCTRLSLSFRFWFHLPLFVRYLQHMCQWQLKKEVYVKVNVSFLVLSLGFHTFFQQFLAQDEVA